MTTAGDDEAKEVDRLRARLEAGDDSDLDPSVRGLKARVVLHHMFQFTGLADLDGTLLEANQTALDAGGIQRRDVIGSPVWEAHWFTVSTHVQERTRRAVEHAVEQGELVRYDEQVYAGAHGTATIPIDFSVRPVRGTDGRVAFLVLEGRDIAEKEHAKRLKNQLFANVSHELRTPLTLILGRAAALLDDGLATSAREPLERIADNARVLLGKVNDLLHVAALEAGGITVAPRAVDVRELAHRVITDLAPLTRAIDVRLEAADAVPATTDPDQLETILVNLITNATKVVSEGGVIVVAVEVDAPDLVLEVRDDGPGVPTAERERVFDAFHQVTHAASRLHGTGLGLAIVRQLVDLLEGDIDIRDAPEGGACFHVRLPYVPGDPGETTTTEPTRTRGDGEQTASALATQRLAVARPVADRVHRVAPPGQGDHLLLVEDHSDLRHFLTEQLGGDYHVSVAGDGVEALALLSSGEVEPDLVVTDLMMPRMGGDELIAHLQSTAPLADLPVLVLTAREDQRLRDHLLAHGASDYLVKPFSVPELRARVENLLAPVRLNRQLTETNARLQRYARQLSHDLKTPLSSMVGLAETVRARVDELDPVVAASMLDRIVVNGHRMGQFVDDLLAEVSGGDGARPVGVGDVLAEVTSLLSDDLAAHGAHVETTGVLPTVEASPAAVRGVLTNLLVNSLNYRSPDRPLRITVAGHAAGGWAEISVRDNGLGVAPQDRDRIFEPGHRGSDPTKQDRAGSGLGLSASRQLVSRYGGNLWNVPVDPPGAEFRFTLPAAGHTPDE